MNKFLHVVRLTSKKRIGLYLFLAIIFTYLTVFILLGFTQYLFLTSVTLSALNESFTNIIGYGKYNLISNYYRVFINLFIFLLFLFYMHLFYRREKNRQYLNSLKNIIKESSYIATGDFNYKWTTYGNDLDQLVENISKIVLRLKAVMEEERHLEHTKTELITNVSHDLRTPLTSIVGYLRIIEEDKYKDEVELRHYTGIAFEKALNLEQLINELFEYTRMQDRQFVLNKTSINIAEVLGQIIIQNELSFAEHDMICRENISEVKSAILGDGERLARVFENLINNAIHYGKAGKYVDVTAKETDKHIIVTVTNYGNPIPQVDLAHVFERFYRAEKSRATHTGGTGLGLAIAKSIVIHHDGTIEVESNFEKTSFIVKLNKIE